MKPPALIKLFLRQLKQFVEKNSFILVEREASREFMASRGMSMVMLTDVILSLEPKDCFDGPEADRDPHIRHVDRCRVRARLQRGDALPEDVYSSGH